MTFDDDDRRRPLLSVTLPSFGHLVPNGQWRRLLDVARAAEDAGVDRLLVVDHLVMGTHMERYPFGPPPGAPDDPWLEPLTVLAAVSSVTEQVRLATGVLIAPLRNPALLAKSAATLDVLSGGRLELGVGSGWQREEFEAAGVDFDRRGDLLDETLEAVTTLWRDTPASFSGTGLRFDDVHLHPKPQQPAGVPLLIAGGPTPRNLRRLTRWGSGWIPAPRQTPAELAAGVHLVAAAWCEAGRDLAELAVQGSLPVVNGRDGRPDVARSLGEAGALLDAGATTSRSTASQQSSTMRRG